MSPKVPRVLSKRAELTGKVFGRLKVLKYIGIKYDCSLWLLRCYCGSLSEVDIGTLRRKRKPQVSCGHCGDVEKYNSEYITWRNMQRRCHNTEDKDYVNYGARGITVCERWRSDFLFFLEDMGLKEHPNLTIERNDVNGNYEPSNCRWIPRSWQNMNKRNSMASVTISD